MRVLPYARFVLRVPLNAHEVARRIESVTFVDAWPRVPTNNEAFRGRVDGNRFEVVRAMSRSRNTYLPLLQGRITSRGSRHSKVSVIATLQPVAIVVIVGFLTIFACLFLAWGRSLLWILVGFPVFHFVNCAVGFTPEVKAARAELSQLLAD